MIVVLYIGLAIYRTMVRLWDVLSDINPNDLD